MNKIKVKTKKLYTQEVYDNTMRARVVNKDWREYDKWMSELIKRNGTTKY
jgi:hypothetical protein